ncbi:MAG: hypothetical protein EXR47_01235 [Dehalococcoidia bacterium]|nr:hypothetical protein [Dehalococcoidia bacterium]
MITHKTTVTVNESAADVFTVVGADYVANHPKWDAKVVSPQLEPSGPMALGARGRETRKQGGRTMTYQFEVTDFKPGSAFAFRAHGGPVQLTASYAVKPLSAKQSQLDIEVTMKMGGVMRLMEPFMAGGVKKEFNAITAEIKRMIEA